VLAPTRELALQIAEHFAMLGGARGSARSPHRAASRWCQLAGSRASRRHRGHAGPALRPHRAAQRPLSSVRIVVLDEGSHAWTWVSAPASRAHPGRHAARSPDALLLGDHAEEVERLVRKHLSRPERVEVGTVASVAAVTQRLYATDSGQKMPLLLQLLGAERGQTLRFTRTKPRADAWRARGRAGIASHDCTPPHMSQRREALDGFRAPLPRAGTTDIAARGIDVPGDLARRQFRPPHTRRITSTASAVTRACRGDRAGDELRRAGERDQLRAIERHLGHPCRELKQKLATTDHDGRINKGANDAGGQ